MKPTSQLELTSRAIATAHPVVRRPRPEVGKVLIGMTSRSSASPASPPTSQVFQHRRQSDRPRWRSRGSCRGGTMLPSGPDSGLDACNCSFVCRWVTRTLTSSPSTFSSCPRVLRVTLGNSCCGVAAGTSSLSPSSPDQSKKESEKANSHVTGTIPFRPVHLEHGTLTENLRYSHRIRRIDQSLVQP